jgi:hypothetical protein
MGEGIAGVATKADGEGIKVYNEKSKYKEWEFLYDPRQDKSPQTAQGGQGNLSGMGTGGNNQQRSNQPSPFGSSGPAPPTPRR